jgi:hypothetical protein
VTSIRGAVIALTAKPQGILVVLLFALVLATLVSQAFSIRRHPLPRGLLAGAADRARCLPPLVRRNVRKRRKLAKTIKKQLALVRMESFALMRRANVPRSVIRIVEDIEDPEDADPGDPLTASPVWSEEQLPRPRSSTG